MRLMTAFLKLIRWQNLIFVILTQLLFYYCVHQSLYPTAAPAYKIAWIIIASVFIAAGGYIINDYFDLNIDRINKPSKNVIDTSISRRWAIIWHLSLSFSGIVATVIAVSFHKWYLIIANIICVILLWFYSTSFKRQLVIGNVIISLLTAWTVLVLFFAQVPFRAALGDGSPVSIRYFKVAFLYGGFAFVISLVREAIKDIEDMPGDARYDCKTLPLVAGVTATKIYVGVWLAVLILSLFVLQLYIMQLGWWWAIVYTVIMVIVPLLYLFAQLYKAKTTRDFAYLSNATKVIMLTGILSLIFFKIYF